MKLKSRICMLIALIIPVVIVNGQKPRPNEAGDLELTKKIARFAPTILTADTSRLTPQDRKALGEIISAAKLMDHIFMLQVWSGNEALLNRISAYQAFPFRQRVHYFLINKGPWSRLDNNEPFIENVPQIKQKLQKFGNHCCNNNNLSGRSELLQS